jgi:alanine racemase
MPLDGGPDRPRAGPAREASVLNWVEIDAAAIRHNLALFRRRVGSDVQLGAVVKANAYGHGMLEVARIAVDAGADWLCVNNLDEGARLREAGFDLPIHVMGYVPRDGLPEVVARDLRIVAYNEETLDGLASVARARDRTVPVHLKVETGTNRQGVPENEVPRFLERIRKLEPHVVLEGLTTHYANIEDTTDHGYAEQQIAAFGRVVDLVERAIGRRVRFRHTACSAAALLFDRTHGDLVRIGISMYGLWSSRETLVSHRERRAREVDLHPAMTWKTRIAQVKWVPEDSFIGYGCTYRTTRPTRIAVLPTGYHEGYDRRLSGVGHVLVRGRRAPVRGRVCMNMTMVDVTDVPVAGVEDEVVLLGSQGDETVSADQIAAWCGTIHYEIVSRIHPGLPRWVI